MLDHRDPIFHYQNVNINKFLPEPKEKTNQTTETNKNSFLIHLRANGDGELGSFMHQNRGEVSWRLLKNYILEGSSTWRIISEFRNCMNIWGKSKVEWKPNKGYMHNIVHKDGRRQPHLWGHPRVGEDRYGRHHN